MDLSVVFVGTGGSVPTGRRGLPAFVVRAGGERLLVDCGEGTQRQLMRSIGLPELDAVFLTHYHADHWLGLPGMLKTFDLRGRERPLTVYGPPGLERLMAGAMALVGRTSFELQIEELDRFDAIEFDGYAIESFPVEHRVTAYGYAFVEDTRRGRFDPDAARALGIDDVRDFGRLQRGETVEVAGGGVVHPGQVIGAERPGRRVVFSGDTIPCAATEEMAHGAQALVHEATFVHADAARAAETRHATARAAAELAARADVRLLALTHVSMRYFPRDVLAEAREVFPGAVMPRDFDVLDVPFPERGEPVVRAPDDADTEPDAGSDPA